MISASRVTTASAPGRSDSSSSRIFTTVVASLADRVALSRSVFAAKFSQLVGEPPLRYLTRLRLNSAALRLRSTEDGLKTIAAAAGYESVAAFAKAFKRHMGMMPGLYRKNREPQ
jgi:AraC-like DNA-binding protein